MNENVLVIQSLSDETVAFVFDLAALRADPAWTDFEFSRVVGERFEQAIDERDFERALAVGGIT